VRKGIFVVPVLFVPALLFPCFVFSQAAEIAGIERLREGFLAGGLSFEEGALFPGDSGIYENGMYPEKGLLVRFGQGAPFPSRYSSGVSPLFVIFIPVAGGQKGIGYYLSLCEELKKKPPLAADIVIVFYENSGGPFALSGGGREDAEKGVSVFAEISEAPEGVLFWRLDFEDFPPRSIRIEYAPEGKKAPLLLVQGIPNLCDSLGIAYTLVGHSAGSGEKGGGAGQNTGKDGGNELPEFARELGIGVLRVRGLGEGSEEKAGNLSAAGLADLLRGYADSLIKGGFDSGKLTINVDYNYSLLRLPRGVLFISEKSKIIIALFAFAALNLAAVILFIARS
jgi:hypothetical protein